ncbi:MAG: FGGY family carbohydrate kinase [Kocuria sp.]|nr:FGGY family carbohydrate kinase [Kocuria sp.]
MYLGVDIGTGSTKGVLVDEHGRIHHKKVVEHMMSTPRTGWAEFDAEAQWWAEIQEICQYLTTACTDQPLDGVCVSGMGPCLVLTDANLTPVRPAILYGVDTRAQEQIDQLTRSLGAEAIVESCGNALSSQSVGPKMRWVRDHEPQNFARSRYWFSAHNYIVAKLTGEYTVDHHTASQSDPLYDLVAAGWSSPWYSQVAEHLEPPRLVWPADVVGRITAEAAECTGIAVGTPVCAGTIDAWAEAWGAGVRDPGDTMLQYGSTFFVIQNLKEPSTHAQLWSTAGVAPESRCLAAGTATSGSLTTWWRHLWGDPEFSDLVTAAAQVPPGSRGVMVLPYFAGERTPIFDPDARGTVTGLTLSHGAPELFRATYEGIACGVRQILELLEDGAERPERLVAVGGGTSSDLWVQLVSNITGRTQEVPEQTIGAAYGDAMMVAQTVGGVDTRRWTRVERVVEPQQEHQALYEEIFADFTQLYALNRELMHRSAARQRHAESEAD